MSSFLVPALAIIGLVVLLYVAALFGIAWFMLHPWRLPHYLSPRAVDLPQERVEFVSEDATMLRGWWIEHPNPSSVALLCHGYFMNRGEGIPLAMQLHKAGMSCFCFDFRAHGTSGGKRTSIGWIERLDVVAAMKVVREKYPTTPAWVWGSSMGGAASTLAIHHEGMRAAALVLDSAYATLHEASSGWWHTFLGKRFVWLLAPIWWVSWKITGIDPRTVSVENALKGLEIPVLFLHGDRDIIAPKAILDRNFAATQNGTQKLFAGAGHGQSRILYPEEYDAVIFAFLEENGLAKRT